MSDTMEAAQGLGDLIYKLHTSQGGRSGVGDLTIEWAKDHYYGLRMQDKLTDFNELWNKLTDNGMVSKKTSLCTGDADISLWAERLDDRTKLIISESHCTCADDNTTIYKLREYDCGDGFGEDISTERMESINKMMFEFHIFTAYPRQVSSKSGYDWGDHRDIDKPSLRTHRKHKFNFGYRDGRDDFHVAMMKYHHTGKPMVDKSSWNEGRISIELEELTRQNGMFELEIKNI
jgi:hypothetical protein